jgi:branched-chain amino acid transport system permease protein
MTVTSLVAIRTAGKEHVGVSWRLVAVASVALVCYLLFPDNLAFLTRIISVSLLVLSLDLLVGYCGVATLGQSALYGVGAYASGIAAVHGMHDPVLLFVVGTIAGSLAGVAMGALLLRGRGLSQLVLSIALVQVLSEAANKLAFVTGGSDGLNGVNASPVFGIFAFDLFGRTAYAVGVVLLIGTLAILNRVVRSPFGVTCQGIKQDPERIRAMGIETKSVLLRMFMISGAVAGLGGALNAVSTQVVGLYSISFEMSASALVMLVLGGSGRLFGALLGAATLLLIEHELSAINPFHWMTMVGVMLIVVVLYLPQGLSGVLGVITSRYRRSA